MPQMLFVVEIISLKVTSLLKIGPKRDKYFELDGFMDAFRERNIPYSAG
jgi:hypothetical protein